VVTSPKRRIILHSGLGSSPGVNILKLNLPSRRASRQRGGLQKRSLDFRTCDCGRPCSVWRFPDGAEADAADLFSKLQSLGGPG
jgi:hypothetical protein